VWGGVLIAAIMAYITFRFLHDSELFKEHIMFAMAIAAAVGVVLAGFLLTMENLIGWGFLIMLLVFLIGALYAIFGRASGDGGDGDGGGRDGGDTDGDDGTGGDDGDGGGTGGERPPGPEPPPTVVPPNPADPKDPPKFVPGLTPSGPRPTAPKLPKNPKIPKDKEIFIDLSPHFNGIRNQDGLGACSAFAATSIFEYILKRGYGFHAKCVSPLYLWYKTRKTIGKVGENTGPWTCVVPMQNLQQEGVCLEELWPFEPHPSEEWKRAPEPSAEADAPTKKILEVHAVDKNDPDQWVYQLKEGNPLNIAINCPSGFSSYKEKLYTNFNPSTSGGHAMVIVGYHSHYPYEGRGIKAFKIRNSWGPHWGENGYVWMPAEILKKILFEDPLVIKGWKKGKPEPQKKEQEKITPEVIKGLREVEKIAASIRDCAKKKEFIIGGKKRKEWINSLRQLLEVFEGREFGPSMNKVLEMLYGEPQKVLKEYKCKNLRELCETTGEEKAPEAALKDQDDALFLAQEVLKAINALKER
ncbi:MAG: C1 family peptidase, partial [Nanoarchaeota archaeon]